MMSDKSIAKTRAKTSVQISLETPHQRILETSSRLSKRTPWRSARFIPYTKTPVTHTLKSTKRSVSHAVGRHIRSPPTRDQTPAAELLKDLIGKTWRVYKLSPMYRFSHEAGHLRQYSRVLSAFLECEWSKGLAITPDNEQVNVATISIFKGLPRERFEPEAIQILLKQKPKQESGEAKVVATAILCCVGAGEDELAGVADQFVLLPVLLYKGPLSVGSCLITWLQSQFDCTIRPVVFSPIFLSWMVAMWAGSTLDKKGHPVELQYKVPVEGLDHIILDIDSQDCKILWDCIHTSETDDFHKHEVVQFIQALQSHFYHYFKVNITAMPLCKAGTAITFLSAEGQLKVFSADHLQQVLCHVTEYVLERGIK